MSGVSRAGSAVARAVPVSALTASDWDEVWAFAARYTDATREGFERSVRGKKVFVFLRDRRSKALAGIGAVDVFDLEVEGRDVVVIFPGNTLVDERYRGQNLIQAEGFRQHLRARLRHPLRPVFLLYDTFSYKSYLMLSRNFGAYWPRPDAPTPPFETALMEAVARRRYGDGWDPARGVAPGDGRRLKDWVAPAHEALAEPAVAFFVARNPGYDRGDLLLVAAPLDLRNWLSVGAGFLRRSLGRKPRRAASSSEKGS